MSSGSAVSRRARRAQAASPSRGDARETALLATAERLLADGRFNEANLSEVAREAGMSRQNFYFYFASKQALLAALVSRTLRELRAELLASLERDSSDPVEAIAGACHAAAEAWCRHRHVLVVANVLAGTVPEVFELIKELSGAASGVSAEHLLAIGRTPETSTLAAARETARMLTWMGERTMYVLALEGGQSADFHALADRFHVFWLSAAGIARTRSAGE